MRYVNVSPASVRSGSYPLAAVTSVTFFNIFTPGCRGRGVVHDATAVTSDGEGVGDEETTDASSDISPTSMSA